MNMKGNNDHRIVFIMMNLDAYPDAFNVYETLGECQMKAAGAEEAKSSFEKGLELCPPECIYEEVVGTCGV